MAKLSAPTLRLKVLIPVLAILCASVAPAQSRRHVNGRLLVGFNQTVTDNAADQIVRGHKGKSHAKIGASQVHVVQLVDGADEQAALNELKNQPGVDFVEFDEIVDPTTTPNDPLYASGQSYYPQINAPAGWSIGTGSSSVIIAIIDTGVNVNHPDLAAKIVQPHSVLTGTSDVTDNYGHGTMTAGTAAAISNNGTGVAGTCWQCLIMPIKVSDGSATYSDLANGLDWARTHGARVANISFEISTSGTIASIAQSFAAAGGVTTVSAGNESLFVANADNPYELTVGAIDSGNNLYSWSNYGNIVDVVAPGCVYTTTAAGSYGSGCGTSFSAPLTAGLAGLMISKNPSLTAAQVMSMVRQTATDLGAPGWDTTFGAGDINVGAAMAAAGSPSGDTVPPTVSIVSPANGTSVSGIVTAQAAATDNVGVASVTLTVDGASLCTATAAPYSCSWNTGTAVNGGHTVSATARDAAGNSAVANSSVTVNNTVPTAPPVVTLSNPTNGSTVSGNVMMQASATDSAGVSSMSIAVDGSTMCSTAGGAISCSWSSASSANGSHTLVASALDPMGNLGTTTSTVMVNNGTPGSGGGDTTAPNAWITSPANGAWVGKNVYVTATAVDNVGVTSVSLYVDGGLIGTDTTAPYTFTWRAQQYPKGTHTLVVKAYDAAGNMGTSAPVVVTR
jgi:subtilisin family serine protease